ncbi:MAG: tetratricopeptide repeat protein [Planctomycetes bacterium]|nr:tetratricopeptide repeat protein [Planctomycetota bacterium]
MSSMRVRLTLGSWLAAAAALAPTPVRAETVQDRFYRGYYVETAGGDCAAAAKIYNEVIADRAVDPDTRAKAQARLAGCQEVLTTADFARLMPPNALVYAELRSPGEQMLALLDQLGLLAGSDAGQPAAGVGAPKLAISPALVRELFGIRGLAVAITGIDPTKPVPVSGVAVFDPGNVDLIRGIIETGLPAGGAIVEPIGGFATYEIEDGVQITLTAKLAVASMDRKLIEGVIRRLKGEEQSSLAGNQAMADVLKDRDDALLFFFVNAKPIMPMLNGLLATAAMHSREAAVAQAVLDVNSLQSLTGRAGINGDGLSLDLSLRLTEGHHNLVYNLLRTPPINRDTLKCVPEGAAVLIAGALNEAPSRQTAGTTAPPTSGAPVVTALDFGREIFANITTVALFALTPDDGDAASTGWKMPDVAAAITVNDPAKSQALWTMVLGIAGMATGGGALEGSAGDIEGVPARSFKFPEGVTLHFATEGNDVLIASTPSAMARALRAKRGGQSALTDAAFAKGLARLTPETTKAVFVHAGRCAAMAKRFMSPRDAAEITPFVPALQQTVGALVVDHSAGLLHIGLAVTGVPKVGGLIAELMAKEQEAERMGNAIRGAMKQKKWDEALKHIEARIAQAGADGKLLTRKFDVLAVGKKDRAAALACAEDLFQTIHDDANDLNTFAWELLTEARYEGQYAELALKFSQRSNELTNQKAWAYVDTLALAKFESGDAESAVALEKRAIELCKDKNRNDLKNALARFEEGLKQRQAAGK